MGRQFGQGAAWLIVGALLLGLAVMRPVHHGPERPMRPAPSVPLPSNDQPEQRLDRHEFERDPDRDRGSATERPSDRMVGADAVAAGRPVADITIQ